MSGELATQESLAGVVEQVVVGGDLAKLSSHDRLRYYTAVCKSVGLNPLTRPFSYIHLSGRLVLYANRDATDQLREKHDVSVYQLDREVTEGIYLVTAYARNGKGRIDSSIGAVPIENLRGEARSNAMMKAETKAKRRVTLSICGLGMLDETETGSIPDARPAKIDYETGEVHDEPSETSTHERTGPVAHVGGAPAVVEADAPLNEELERSILLAKVKGAADKLGWKADKRAAAWDTYCQGMDPRAATLEALNDLYAYLLAQTK